MSTLGKKLKENFDNIDENILTLEKNDKELLKMIVHLTDRVKVLESKETPNEGE